MFAVIGNLSVSEYMTGKKKRGVQGQVYMSPHRKRKISRRQSAGHNVEAGASVS